MELTRYEVGELRQLVGEIRGQNSKETWDLVNMLDELDVTLEDGETLEVDDDHLKRCWKVAQRFGPTYETSVRGAKWAEKLESL